MKNVDHCGRLQLHYNNYRLDLATVQQADMLEFMILKLRGSMGQSSLSNGTSEAQRMSELEFAIADELIGQMTPEQIDDFQNFIDQDLGFARKYLNSLDPIWKDDKNFQTQSQKLLDAGASEKALTSEYAAYRWLCANFPDYRKVVRRAKEAQERE